MNEITRRQFLRQSVLGASLAGLTRSATGGTPGSPGRTGASVKNIFLNTIYLTAAKRQEITTRLRRQNNSHFLSIHTASGGPKRIRLPRRTDVYDAYSEQLIAREALEFTDDLPPFGTRVYFLGDLAQIRDESTRF